MKVHCFHGFLGDKSEFDFLKNALGADIEIQAYDMGKLCAGSKEDAFSGLNISKDDILIGYSFGARFALETLGRFEFQKLIMLGGHAGLRPEEIETRIKVENNFVEKIESLSFEEFVRWWNALDLFKHDAPINPRPWSKELMVHMFREYGLSKQKNYENLLEKRNESVLWICGLLDQKYLAHTRERVEPLGVKCRYVDAGHRLFQKRTEIKELIAKELEQA